MYIHMHIHLQSANLFGQNLGKLGNHGSGTEESFSKQMRGQLSDTIPAIFRNIYGKRSGTIGGGRDYERMCIYMAC